MTKRGKRRKDRKVKWERKEKDKSRNWPEQAVVSHAYNPTT